LVGTRTGLEGLEKKILFSLYWNSKPDISKKKCSVLFFRDPEDGGQQIYNKVRGDTSAKTVIFIVTTVRN
jgi:hypothetical protein